MTPQLPKSTHIAPIHGRYYEDFVPGRQFTHHWGRTILDFDSAQFSAITMHYNPLYFNREHARALGFDDIPVNPLFLLYLTLGLSVEDLSEFGGPLLGCTDVRFPGPAYPGTTLYARSTVLNQRLTASRPGWGVVEWFTEGYDSRGRVLVDFKRRNLAIAAASKASATEPGASPRTGKDARPSADDEGQQRELAPHAVEKVPAGDGRYFEDYAVGQIYHHGRGKTVSEMDNYLLTHMTMNTAQAHFNLKYMEDFFGGRFKERLVMGGCTMAIVIGLTAQDMSEHALADIGYDAMRLPNPVFHGDTLYARSEVLDVQPSSDRGDAGTVRYRATGHNQRGQLVVEAERTVLIRRR